MSQMSISDTFRTTFLAPKQMFGATNQFLNNSKLGNVTVLTATSTTAASNKYSDELSH